MNVKRSAVRAAAQVIVTLTGCATLAAIVAILAVLPYISPGRTASGATTAPSVVIPLRAIPRGWKQHEYESEERIVAKTVWKSQHGDMNATASWTNGIPGAGDTAMFDGKLSQVSAIGYDFGAAAFDLATTPGYRGDIGTQAAPLDWGGPNANGRVTIRGTGRVHLAPSQGTIIVDSGNLIDAVSVQGVISGMLVKSGAAIIESTCSLGGTPVEIFGPLGTVQVLDKAASELGFGTARILAGRFICARDAEANSRVVVSGGHMEMTGALINTPIVIVLGGVLDYTPADQTARTMGLYAYGGLVDLSKNREAIINGTIIIGPDGDIAGSVTEYGGTVTTYDLREDYP